MGAENTSDKVFVIAYRLTEHGGHLGLMVIKQYLLTTKPLMTEEIYYTLQY